MAGPGKAGLVSTPGADLIFRGGVVITVDRAFSLAQAAAVRAGRIIAVGEERELTALAGPDTRVVELDGGALLPGINDSHLHAALLGLYAPHYRLDASGRGTLPLPRPRALRTEAARRAALRRAWGLLLPLGVTSYTEPGLGPGAERQHGGACGAAMLATYQRLAQERALPLRVTVLALYGKLDGPCDPLLYMDAVAALHAGVAAPSARLRVAGVKLFADGTLPARSAWIDQPYVDGGAGALLIPGASEELQVELLDAMVAAAHASGLQVGVHASGSRAIDVTVRAFERACVRHGARDLRHYVIGGECASRAALSRLANGGFGLNAQPAVRDATARLVDGALGRERAARAFPLQSALEAGVKLCLSSDAPTLAPDWRRDVAAAVAGGGAGAVPHPGVSEKRRERISLEQALRAYTIVPARQDHAERFKGSIEVGKVADLCVLAQNPLTIDVAELPEVAVTMTVVGGKIAYEPAQRSRSARR